MRSTAFAACLTLLAIVTTASAETASSEKTTQPVIEKLPDKDAPCLAEACRITALINEGKWGELEKIFGPDPNMLFVLKRDAGIKGWQGIGAYRGFSINEEKPRKVTFRFGFAPKSSPHEVWISFTDSNPSKPGLTVLGW